MAAKSKRFSPRPQVGTPSVGSSVNVPTAAATGATPPPSSQPLQQLSQSLSRFNRSLVGYQMGKLDKAQEEAQQYLQGMTASEQISNKSYGFRKYLKKNGFSQWMNPWVYSKQIINVAGLQARKDLASIIRDPDFQSEINAIKGDANFPEESKEILEKYKKTNFDRQAEYEKEGAYWDVGYGESWVSESEAFLNKAADLSSEHQKVLVKKTFFEKGQDALHRAIQADDKNIFRDFLTEDFTSFPDDELQFNIAVFENIIKPMFEQMVEQGEDLDSVFDMYDKITSLTRTTEEGNRVSMFKRFSDVNPNDNTFESVASFLAELEDKYTTAATRRLTRDTQREARLAKKISQDLSSLQNLKEQHADKFAAANLSDLQFPFDATDRVLMRKVAGLFMDIHSDDTDALADSEADEARIFYDVWLEAVTLANKKEVANAKSSTDALAAFNESTANMVGRWVDSRGLAEDLRGMVRKNILKGKGSKQYPAEWLAKWGPIGVKRMFYSDNPDIPYGTVAFESAITRHMRPIVDGTIVAEAELLLARVREKYNNRDTDEGDLRSLMAVSTDLANDEATGALRDQVSSWITRVEKLNNNAKQYDHVSLPTLKKDLIEDVYSDWRTGFSGNQFIEIEKLDNEKFEFSSITEGAFSQPDNKVAAAKKVMNWLRNDAYQEAANEAIEATLDTIDPNQPKDTWWANQGQKMFREEMKTRLNGLKDQVLERWQTESAKGTSKADAAQAGGELTGADQQRHMGLTAITNEIGDFYADKKLTSNQAIKNTLEGGSSSLMERFFAGDTGEKSWNFIRQTNREAAQALDKKLADYATAKNNLATLRNQDTPADQLTQAEKALGVRELQIKSHIRAFGVIPWKQLAEGKVLVPTKMGEDIELPFSHSDVHLGQHLIFSSLSEMRDIASSIRGVIADYPDKPIELNQIPEDLQKFAQVVKATHGLDIFHSSPKERMNNIRELSRNFQKQFNMLLVKRPESVPKSTFKAIRHRVLESFTNSDRNTWQGEEVDSNDKEFAKHLFRQNNDIIAGKYNVEDGISLDEFIDLYRKSTGNTMPLYASGSPFRRRWTPYWEKKIKEGVQRSTNTLNAALLSQFGEVSRGMGAMPKGKKVSSVDFEKSILSVIAIETAYASLGLPNPHHHQFMKRGGFQRVYDTIGTNEQEFKTKYFAAKQKYQTLFRNVQKNRNVPSSDLAEAFNTLAAVMDSKDIVRPTTGKIVPNKWGLAPMLIPHKPAPLTKEELKANPPE